MDNPFSAIWPSSGRVEVQDLVVGYLSGEILLKGITMQIEPGECIGIVGRTGAGKSTLSLALFHFLEATAEKIVIDGIEIALIRLLDLRSRLSIISQDPVLFTVPLGQSGIRSMSITTRNCVMLLRWSTLRPAGTLSFRERQRRKTLRSDFPSYSPETLPRAATASLKAKDNYYAWLELYEPGHEFLSWMKPPAALT